MKKFTPPLEIESNKFIAPFAILICTVLMSLTCYNNPFTIGNFGGDSAVYAYVGRLILNGGMPYRDTFDNKGPLMYLIDALGLYLNKDIGIWIMELIFIFAALLFAYKIARLIGCSKVKSMAVTAVTTLAFAYYFEGGNFTEEYACTFIMLSLYIFLKYFKNGTVNIIELILCGVSFGAVCLLRINMVALWGAMFICVLIDCIRRKKLIDFLRYILFSALGVAIIVIPIIIWLAKNDAFSLLLKIILHSALFKLLNPDEHLLKNIYAQFINLLQAESLLSVSQ